MGEQTEYIRRMSNSVESAKQVKGEIKNICGEIDQLIQKSESDRKKRSRKKKHGLPGIR